MRLIDADKGLISKIQRETGCNFITAQKIVDSMPTVEERKVGEWKKNEHTFWTCSECGLVNKYNRVQYAYCPNCGTEMRGAEDGSN